MNCPNCRRPIESGISSCPHCSARVPSNLAGLLKTSTILISADDTNGVYHSVQEVPEPLRKKLLRSTNSLHSRTILIADRRGRQEIARVLRNLPGARNLPGVAQRGASNSPITGDLIRASVSRTQIIGMAIAAAAGLAAWLVLFHQW